ncbi:methyltransferase domain-containing protein [Thiobacillus sp.]|uniref:methyltransferase domain-containing protein n=1 Tax=Thiobacillus sp. TaxID=924 RepID=UPI0011D905E3|nr:methyltransferase domain-containing protein [Thiobacillus sp.]TXH76306.1 MAG: methyltransferase domain-containing protein [Thiobacillus sp.]
MLDKNDFLDRLDQLNKVVLELGCGPNKKLMSAIGIDAINYEGVDIVGDIFEVLGKFPEESVDSVHSFHFFEHIVNFQELLSNIARVMRPGGDLEVVVPHFSNPYFYSDPTHRTFFGLYTFCYYASESLFSRKVPTYQHTIQFDLISVDLVFKSTRPFFIRHGIKKLFGLIFNSVGYMQEFYEENLSQIVPCYEVRYRLRKK